MTNSKKKLLFISHDSSQTGATLVLFELVSWLKNNSTIDPVVLLKDSSGPLKKRFQNIVKVYEYTFPVPGSGNSILTSFHRKFIYPITFQNFRKKLLAALLAENFDLIYNNTISNGQVLEFLGNVKCPVISHIHELQYVIDCLGNENAELTIKRTSHFIAVSEEVKLLLNQKLLVPLEKISVVPPFVDFAKINKLKDEVSTTQLRSELGIPETAFTVGSSGSIEWRKGADLFVQTAIRSVKASNNIFFIWLGADRENITGKLNYDIRKAGLENNIRFIGPKPNPYPYYEMFDLFLLPSREDPYPLVCIENMCLNKTVFCFEGSGGAPSLLNRYKTGKTFEYLDIAAVSDAIIASSRETNHSLLNIDQAQLSAEHHTSTVSEKIKDLILGIMTP